MPKAADEVTPIRGQYLEVKRQHPDAIVFFRLGDFYETFDADAELVAGELDIVLTSRNVAKGQRIPMAGVPYHAVEGYIARLISKGYTCGDLRADGAPAGERIDAPRSGASGDARHGNGTHPVER
jgi:DNA mismatch repair protein MutS